MQKNKHVTKIFTLPQWIKQHVRCIAIVKRESTKCNVYNINTNMVWILLRNVYLL